jgi:hypothetical protein
MAARYRLLLTAPRQVSNKHAVSNRKNGPTRFSPAVSARRSINPLLTLTGCCSGHGHIKRGVDTPPVTQSAHGLIGQKPMRYGKSHELIAYWEQLRGTRAAPERSEIAPAALARQLADIFILQAGSGNEAKFRLAGTRICSIHGRELKDTSFELLWQVQDRRNISRLVASSMTGKRPVSVNSEGISTRDRAALFEFILLPLASEAHERFLIGMIVALGRPFWLESDSIVENRIRAISTLDSHRIKHDQNISRMAPPPESAIRTIIGSRTDHLQLLEGGKSSRHIKTGRKPPPQR